MREEKDEEGAVFVVADELLRTVPRPKEKASVVLVSTRRKLATTMRRMPVERQKGKLMLMMKLKW